MSFTNFDSCVIFNCTISTVLDRFNFTLQGGRIVGLLGPNGCGKSTLMKLVCGILVPDSGEIFVCGEPRSETTNSFISYLPERTYFSAW
ncbi:MAG: ATP-binding cassette domain-containing protein, partial [Lachnospiraceae bacterium]|nr:ATP-binding cassette domain-containing protein [Lachnospiraceae bacterium]